MTFFSLQKCAVWNAALYLVQMLINATVWRCPGRWRFDWTSSTWWLLQRIHTCFSKENKEWCRLSSSQTFGYSGHVTLTPASLTFISLACTFCWRGRKGSASLNCQFRGINHFRQAIVLLSSLKDRVSTRREGEGASTSRPRRCAPGYSVAPLGGRGAAHCFLSELFWASVKFWLKVLSTAAGCIRHHVSISQTDQCGSIKLSRWTVSQIYRWVLDSLSEVQGERINYMSGGTFVF